MDIYILHKGQESGPYSEKAVTQLLDQGSIAPSDFAWRQGWPDWRPISEFLAVPATPPPASPPPSAEEKVVPQEPKKEEGGSEPAKSAEPATAKQKALLNFLRIALPAELSKDQASGLINDAMEDPKHAGRLALWNEERLRLHPELFAAEIQAKKENRANHFFELCQTARAEYFNGISKAHCQVLVSFLDVKFPHWGTPETDAAEHYFFPAVAEKFPQLVQKQWRGRLKYVDGGKVAPEIVQKSATSKMQPARTSPMAAIGRGLVIGLVILGALYLGRWTLQHQVTAAAPIDGPSAVAPSATASIPAATPQAGPSAAATVANTVPPAALPPAAPAAPAAPNNQPPPADPAPDTVAVSAPTPPPSASSSDVAGMAPMTPTAPLPGGEPPAPVAPPPPTLPVAGNLPTAPSAPMASADLTPPILGPDPTGGGPSPATGITPPPGSAMSTATVARINLLLTRPVEIQLAYGKIMLPPGTPVKLMSRQGTALRVTYQNSVITVPVSSTDLE